MDVIVLCQVSIETSFAGFSVWSAPTFRGKSYKAFFKRGSEGDGFSHPFSLQSQLRNCRTRLIFIQPVFDIDHKTSCHQFEANEARLKRGVIAYNILQVIREFYVWGEPVKRSMEWLIMRLIKVGARVTYHGRYWYVHIASAFPLRNHYRAVLAWA